MYTTSGSMDTPAILRREYGCPNKSCTLGRQGVRGRGGVVRGSGCFLDMINRIKKAWGLSPFGVLDVISDVFTNVVCGVIMAIS